LVLRVNHGRAFRSPRPAYIRDTIEVLISSAYLLSFITLWTGVERG
jgi:hypothetical protein